jgi:hypothetical protein
MCNNLDVELLVAREKRRDLLRRAAQNRLLRLAKTRSESSARADRRTQGGLKIRMVWRKAIT